MGISEGEVLNNPSPGTALGSARVLSFYKSLNGNILLAVSNLYNIFDINICETKPKGWIRQPN